MSIAALPGRHGRLAALCGLSLLLHLLAIAWVDAAFFSSAPPAPPPGRPELAVRLVSPRPAAPARQAAAVPRPAAAPVEDAPPAPVRRASLAEVLQLSSAPAEPGEQDGPAAGAQPPQLPSRYRVSVPPSVQIRYELRGPAPGAALLEWHTDGVQYSMALSGVLGAIESEGGTDDAGLAPARASFARGTGSVAVGFARERGLIVLESQGRSVQDVPGSQDAATVLMQLAGIALADPGQLQDAVEILVAHADGAAVERFEVAGKERIATPLGALDTLRLTRAGATRLEVWLASGRGWLPVQLRTSSPEGGVRTQVVKEIRQAPAGSPAP